MVEERMMANDGCFEQAVSPRTPESCGAHSTRELRETELALVACGGPVHGGLNQSTSLTRLADVARSTPQTQTCGVEPDRSSRRNELTHGSDHEEQNGQSTR